MPKFVLAFTGGSNPETEEAQVAVMAAWTTWFSTLGEAVADPGNPFGPAVSIASDGTITEGGNSALSGYSVISADSLAEAAQAASSCPILADGGTIEVYETFDVM